MATDTQTQEVRIRLPGVDPTKLHSLTEAIRQAAERAGAERVEIEQEGEGGGGSDPLPSPRRSLIDHLKEGIRLLGREERLARRTRQLLLGTAAITLASAANLVAVLVAMGTMSVPFWAALAVLIGMTLVVVFGVRTWRSCEATYHETAATYHETRGNVQAFRAFLLSRGEPDTNLPEIPPDQLACRKPFVMRRFPYFHDRRMRYESAAATSLAAGALAGSFCGAVSLAPVWIGFLLGWGATSILAALAYTANP